MTERERPAEAAGPAGGTIPGLLVEQARTRPTAVALRHKRLGIWQEWTWAQYLEHVRGVARAVHELGLGAGDRAGLLAENRPEWLFADLGVQTVGCLAVGAYTTQPAPDVAYVMGHSRVRIIFCGDQEQVDKVLQVRDELPTLEKIIVFDTRGVAEYGDPMIVAFDEFEAGGLELDRSDPSVVDRLLAARDPEEVALVGYTSGTTGKPKGAMTRHRNQVRMARSTAEWTGLKAGDRDLCYFPLCHPAVRCTDIYAALVTGASVNFPEAADTALKDMVELAPQFILGSPRVFEVLMADIDLRAQKAAWLKRHVFRWSMRSLQRVLDRRLAGKRRLTDPLLRGVAMGLTGHWVLDRLGLSRLKYGQLGGAAVSPELLKFFWSLGVPMYECYGMSETSGGAFWQKDYADLGTAGWALPGIEGRIGPDHELLLRGEGIFAGYLDDEERTAAAFDGDWYRTGDIARFDGEGRLIILDRDKHLIRSTSGEDLSPTEIENKLKLSPYISAAMVIGRDYVTALVQVEYDTTAEWAQVRNLAFTTYRSLVALEDVRQLIGQEVEKANALLPPEKQVRGFALLPRELDADQDELTPTRKIKREVVMQRFADLIEPMYASSPSDPSVAADGQRAAT